MTMLQGRDRQVETRQGRIFVRSWRGDAVDGRAPILLFHDSLGCVELWRSFPEKLARISGHPVIAYDRIGFGRSDAWPGMPGFDFIAREAEDIVPELREQLGFSTFIACGHSVGGGMAVEVAAHFQHDCLALVTMGAQAFVDERIRAGVRLAKEEFAKPDALARLVKYHGDKARAVVDAWTDTWLDAAFAGWTLDGALARIQCPVLAIHGALDEYGSPEHARRIAAGRGTAEILPSIGHVPHREDEAQAVGIVARFLSGSMARGPGLPGA